MIKYLEKENDFLEEVKEGIVLVDFYANWCGPCRMLGGVLEELSNERDDIKILKIDIDVFGEIAKQFGIMSIPTLLFYKNGKLFSKNIGFCNKEKVISLLEN